MLVEKSDGSAFIVTNKEKVAWKCYFESLLDGLTALEEEELRQVHPTEGTATEVGCCMVKIVTRKTGKAVVSSDRFTDSPLCYPCRSIWVNNLACAINLQERGMFYWF